MKLANETKIGMLAAAAIALLILGYSFLRGNDLFSASRRYYAVYDRVDGLSASKPIFVNGYQIGRVEKLELTPSGKIIASLEVSRDINIPANTVAEIQSTDFLGSKAIYFLMGDSRERASDNDTLQSSIEKTLVESVNPMRDRAESMLIKMDSILASLNTIMNPQFRKNVNTSLESVTHTLQTLQSTSVKVDRMVGSSSQRLQAILDNIESISGNLRDNNEQVSQILANVNSITDQVAKGRLEETLANAHKATSDLNAMMEKINRGEGSLGALLNDDSLYYNLNASAEDLDRLMIDLREHPGRYVHFSIFGRKNK